MNFWSIYKNKHFYKNKKLIFFLLILSIFLSLNNYDIYCQSTDVIEQPPASSQEEVILFNPDEQEELKVMPQEPVVVDNKNEKIGLTMNMPVIGDVTLYPEKDASGQEILKATLDGKKINLAPLDIKFDNFTLTLVNNKPSLSSDVTVIGKKGTLELVEIKKESDVKKEPIANTKYSKLSLSIDTVHFRVKFIDKPIISILPNRSLALDYADLIIQKGKAPTLSANILIFGQPVEISFLFDKNNLTLKFTIKQMALGKFYQDRKLDKLSNINLNNLEVSISILKQDLANQAAGQNLEQKKSFNLNFNAEADFSTLNISGVGKLNLNGSYTKSKGLIFQANADNINLPVVGKISQAKFIFYSSDAVKSKAEELKSKLMPALALRSAGKSEAAGSAQPSKAAEDQSNLINQKDNKLEELDLKILSIAQKENKPLMILSGQATLNLPKIGSLDLNLLSQYSADGFEIKGSVVQPVKYAGVSINKAEIDINTKTQEISIIGDSQIQGFDLVATLSALPDRSNPSSKVYKFEAKVNKPEWKPFEKSSVPDFIKNIDLKNLSADLSLSKSGAVSEGQLEIKGQTNIMNISVDADVLAIKSNNKNGVLLKASVPPSKLPSGFNKLPIDNAFFIATSIEYKDPDTNILYNPNTLNLSGKVKLSGVLEPIGKIIGSKDSEFNISGSLDPKNITNNKLVIELSKGFPVKGNSISIGPVIIDLESGPKISLEMHVIVRPRKSEELDFSGKASFDPKLISGEFRMDGMWKDPFGLKGLAIGDLIIGLGINPETFPETLIPSKFDFGGRLSLAPDKNITLAMEIDDTTGKIGFLGELKGDGNKPGKLSLEDIVNFFANRLGAKVPADKIPVIEAEDVKVSFADQNLIVGKINIPQGITIKGKIEIIKTIVEIDFEVSKSGIIAKADMTPIDFGPLKITAGQMASGQIRKTKYGGPEIDIELTASRQKFLISGLIQIDSIISGSGDFEISRSGINFKFEVDLGPDKIFKGMITGVSSGSLKDPDFKLTIEAEQKLTELCKEKISKALEDAQKDVEKGIHNAIDKVKSIDEQIAKHKKELEDAQKRVDDAKKELDKIDKANQEAQSKLSAAQNKVNELQNKINDIDKQINELKKYKCSWRHPIDCTKNKAKIGGLEVEKKAIQASKVIANKTLEGLKKVTNFATMQVAKNTAEKALDAAKGFLKQVASKVDIGVLQASKKAAEGVLEGAEKAGVGVLKGTEFVTKGILSGFVINKITLESSLSEIKKGDLFDIYIDMHILGKEKNYKFKFDVKNIIKSVEQVAKEIANKIKSKLKI